MNHSSARREDRDTAFFGGHLANLSGQLFMKLADSYPQMTELRSFGSVDAALKSLPPKSPYSEFCGKTTNPHLRVSLGNQEIISQQSLIGAAAWAAASSIA